MTLDEYLDKTYPNLPAWKQNEAFGNAVGCKRQSVERWRKFQQSPSLEMSYRIYKMSKDAVLPFDLLNQTQKKEALT